MKYLYPNTIWQVLFLLLITLLLASPFFYVMMTMKIEMDQFATVFFLTYFVLFLGLYFTVSKVKKLPLKLDFHFIPTKNHHIGILILLIISFQIGINLPISETISFLFDFKNESFTPPSILSLVSIIVFASFFEEIMFRGIILRGFLSRYSAQKAIILSSLLFGLIHINPHQILGAILLGLFFSWIYYRTRNIGICILLHIIANGTSMLTEYIQFHKSFNAWYIYGAFSFLFIYLSIQFYRKGEAILTHSTANAIK